MEFTTALLLKLIDDNGGDEKVAAILFNNAYRKVFAKERFDRTKNLVTTTASVLEGSETIELFKFKEPDTTGLEYDIYKPVIYVEGVVFIENEEDRVRMNPRYIAG